MEEEVKDSDILWNLCLTLYVHVPLSYVHTMTFTLQHDTLHYLSNLRTSFQQVKLEEGLESKTLFHEVANLTCILKLLYFESSKTDMYKLF